MSHIKRAEAVVDLALKERRRWLHAYSFHLALDENAMRTIVSIQQTYASAKAALIDEKAIEALRE